MTSSAHPRWRARATTARARVAGTDRPARPSTTRSRPSINTAATSTGSAPGSGIIASRLRSAPISAAASSPKSGSPTTAAWPPAAVTAAAMPTGSERAPESTATVPLGNPAGSSAASDCGTGSKLSEPGSTASAGTAPCQPAPTFPETAAICFRSCSSCSARVGRPFSRAIAAVTAHLPPLSYFECMFDSVSKHRRSDSVKGGVLSG